PEPAPLPTEDAPASAEMPVALDTGPLPWNQALGRLTEPPGVVMQIYRLTPRVQSAGTVELEIVAEPSVTTPGDVPSASRVPRQAVRATVTLRSGQTVRLGGLMANDRQAGPGAPLMVHQQFLLLAPHSKDPVSADAAPLNQPPQFNEGVESEQAAPPPAGLVDGPRIIPGPRRRHALSAESPRALRTE
ncbi:MAG: hypothetical protein ACREIV_02745, partial [Planctomycetaceae bacterium]